MVERAELTPVYCVRDRDTTAQPQPQPPPELSERLCHLPKGNLSSLGLISQPVDEGGDLSHDKGTRWKCSGPDNEASVLGGLMRQVERVRTGPTALLSARPWNTGRAPPCCPRKKGAEIETCGWSGEAAGS